MKKQIHRSLLWLLLLAPPLLWLGCKKDPEPEIIKGHVREYGTNKPIPDAKVNLSVCDGEFGGPISCGLAASTLTDANGYYSFPPHEGVRRANAVKDGYFTDLDSEISILDKPENDIVLFPHAYLKVVVRNESGKYAFISSEITDGVIHQSKNQQDTFSLVVKGNQDYKLLFSILETETTSFTNPNGVKVIADNNIIIPVEYTTGFRMFVYSKGHDTTHLTITY
jgi:hypothetical protein